MKLEFGVRTNSGNRRHVESRFGGVVIPNWVWGAIKEDAAVTQMSEHWVIKQALRQYLVTRGYKQSDFSANRSEDRDLEE